MKKFLSLLFSLVLLCACSSQDNNVKSVVDNYFSSVQSGDYQGAVFYYSDDVEDGYEISGLQEELNEIYQEYDLGEDFEDASNDFVSNVLKRLVSSYTIKEVQVNGNEAIVEAEVNGIHTDALNFDNIDDELNGEIDDYTKNNESVLQQLYLEQGEDAMYAKIYKDFTKIVYDWMNEQVNQADTIDYKVRLELKQVDSQWKFSEIGIYDYELNS